MKKRVRVAVGLFVICILISLFLVSCAEREASSEEEESIGEESVYTIKTDYFDLKFPEKWQAFVKAVPVEKKPYTVKFTHVDGTPLFDIVFGKSSGTLLGTAKSKKGDISVYYVGYDLDSDNVNYYDQVGIQDSADVILQNLKKDYGLTDEATITDSGESDVFAVKTSVVTLYYPKVWEKVVTVKTKKKSVSFFYGDTNLFDIRFEKCDGAFLGTYEKTPIYVVSYDIEQDDFTTEQYRNICAMQDDVNVILENLRKEEKFK